MDNKEKQSLDAFMEQDKQNQINETEQLGRLAREYMKPENLVGPFKSTEELMKSLWDED